MKEKKVYKNYFIENRPARTCIQAGSLPFKTRVEITATAYI
jgi:enamine deaminase RidA (YjgF/YER057c/UK114 family)